MPKLTRIYTRGGDGGKTSLGGGQRVEKHATRIHAFGEIDELNSTIGLALSGPLEDSLRGTLVRVQNELFHLGSDLCILEEDKARLPVPTVEQRHIDLLEEEIDRLTAQLGPLENFILPGGTEGAARLHLARTICRRAERSVASLTAAETVNPLALTYLNRLSDALFVMARFENRHRGIEDVYWDSRA